MDTEQLTEEQLYYKEKYFKYKLKYLTLKEELEGGGFFSSKKTEPAKKAVTAVVAAQTIAKKNTTAPAATAKKPAVVATPAAKKPIVLNKSKTNGGIIESNIEELIDNSKKEFFKENGNMGEMKDNIKRIMEKTMRTQREDYGIGYDLSNLDQVKTMLTKVTDKGYIQGYIRGEYYEYLINNLIQKFFTG